VRRIATDASVSSPDYSPVTGENTPGTPQNLLHLPAFRELIHQLVQERSNPTPTVAQQSGAGHLLKQETGKTDLELIHLHVISEAKNMLIASERSISEIAYQLGFENPPQFSRLSRKEVGISPKEFKSHILN